MTFGVGRQFCMRPIFGRPPPSFGGRDTPSQRPEKVWIHRPSIYLVRSRQNKKLPDRRHHNAPTEPSRSDRIELLVMWRCGPPKPRRGTPFLAAVLLFSGRPFCKLPTEHLRSILADCANNSALSGGALLRPALHHSKIRTLHHPGIRPTFEHPRSFLPLSNTLSNC